MTCEELTQFLMSYLEGELPVDQRQQFEEHLGECPPCRRYLDTYRRTLTLERSLGEGDGGPLPDEVPEELVRAVLDARRRGDG